MAAAKHVEAGNVCGDHQALLETLTRVATSLKWLTRILFLLIPAAGLLAVQLYELKTTVSVQVEKLAMHISQTDRGSSK